jgi:hypothetical protein
MDSMRRVYRKQWKKWGYYFVINIYKIMVYEEYKEYLNLIGIGFILFIASN